MRPPHNPNPSSPAWATRATQTLARRPLLLLPRAAPPPERAAERSRIPWGRRRRGFSPSSRWIWWVRSRPSPGGSSLARAASRGGGGLFPLDPALLRPDRVVARRGHAVVRGGGDRSWAAATTAMVARTAPVTVATTGVGAGAVVAADAVASVATCWPWLDGCRSWLRLAVAGCGGGRSWLWLAGCSWPWLAER